METINEIDVAIQAGHHWSSHSEGGRRVTWGQLKRWFSHNQKVFFCGRHVQSLRCMSDGQIF